MPSNSFSVRSPAGSSRLCDAQPERPSREPAAWVEGRRAGDLTLVNNAGLGRFGPIDELRRRFARSSETNLLGAFYAICAAAPIMKRQGEGWIFNIARSPPRTRSPGGSAYNASKFGMVGMSEAAMPDLGISAFASPRSARAAPRPISGAS